MEISFNLQNEHEHYVHSLMDQGHASLPWLLKESETENICQSYKQENVIILL